MPKDVLPNISKQFNISHTSTLVKNAILYTWERTRPPKSSHTAKTIEAIVQIKWTWLNSNYYAEHIFPP